MDIEKTWGRGFRVSSRSELASDATLASMESTIETRRRGKRGPAPYTSTPRAESKVRIPHQDLEVLTQKAADVGLSLSDYFTYSACLLAHHPAPDYIQRRVDALPADVREELLAS